MVWPFLNSSQGEVLLTEYESLNLRMAHTADTSHNTNASKYLQNFQIEFYRYSLLLYCRWIHGQLFSGKVQVPFSLGIPCRQMCWQMLKLLGKIKEPLWTIAPWLGLVEQFRSKGNHKLYINTVFQILTFHLCIGVLNTDFLTHELLQYLILNTQKHG